MVMRLYRFLLRLALAVGVVSLLAGVAGLVYWYGAGSGSILVAAGSGLLLASGLAAVTTSLILESAETELVRLRHERELLAAECDSNRTRVIRLERRAESLSVVREIHRSTNIITRSERLRQMLTLIGQLAEDVEATLFAVREHVPGQASEATELRPVAYLRSCDSNELFVRFDRPFDAQAAVGIADTVTTTNGSRREIAADLVAEGEAVGHVEAVLVSDDAFGVAAEAAPEDILAWLLGGTDLDCVRPRAAIERGKVIRSRESFDFGEADDIEFLYPLTAEGDMVGAFRLRIPEREVGAPGSGLAAGGLGELDEVLAECARHVALALKKESDADRAITDGLTGLLLKREFEPRLAEALSESTAARSPLALLVVDIDHFKNVNDGYGHRTGDLILRGVAALVRRHIRARDSAYRYGGEELCLVLPGTGAREAKAISERLRDSVESARFTSEVGSEIGVTISIGLAAVDPRRPSGGASGPGLSPAELFRRADAAVYRAKGTGRNRVVAWTSRMKMRSAGAASSGQHRRPEQASSSGQRCGPEKVVKPATAARKRKSRKKSAGKRKRGSRETAERHPRMRKSA
jgi:diguanylate cyclase (GGDEF)-like protein